MKPFQVLIGVAAPLPYANVDTDMIIPGQYVKTIAREGMGVGLFHNLRYLPDGQPNPEFVLNQPAYRQARILVTGTNLGPGSSREHAAWALADFGIRCVISSLIADIFFTNCINSGVLPIVLPERDVQVLLQDAGNPQTSLMTVDLPQQEIVRASGEVIRFEVDPFLKQRLLLGRDDLEMTLMHQREIQDFAARRALTQPWL